MLLPFLLRRQPLMVAILDPFMVGGYGAPKLALAPLFILWFGIGIESKIALVAAVVFFIVYFSTLAGVRALDPKLVQMAQVVGASERQVARHIVFPGAVPYIFAGFRIAVPYAIGGAVIAELISSNRGLGYLVQTGAMNFDTTRGVRRDPRGHHHRSLCQLERRRGRAGLLRWRPAGAGHRRHGTEGDAAAARDQGPRQALPGAAGREPPPWVIQDLSFPVGPGEFLTIIGPSGAGKSTLLNMIAQIDTVSEGEIVFDGEASHRAIRKALRPGSTAGSAT